MKPKIAVGGSAANPPHLAHKKIIEELLNSNKFEKIIWIPSGLRTDKPDFVAPKHRLVMTSLTLPANPKLEINFADAFGKNTPTITWLEKLSAQYPEAEIVWFTGIDSVIPQKQFNGKCEIEAQWHRGKELLAKYPFIIIPRPGFPNPQDFKMPPVKYEIFNVSQVKISSQTIRALIANNDQRFETMVTPTVSDYIKKYQLYGWQNK